MTTPMHTTNATHEDDFFHQVHHQPKELLNEVLGVPAHIHHIAHHMANPPIERAQSQDEFRYVLQCLEIADDDAVIEEKFGCGVKSTDNGDQLIVVWEAHTEYYTYQIWHIMNDKQAQPTFGSITFPDYHFPLCPLGEQITSLDIVIATHQEFTPDQVRQLIPGKFLYGGRMCGDDISVVTSFVEDQNRRETLFSIFISSNLACPQPQSDH